MILRGILRRAVLGARRKAGGRTYPDFQAYIATLTNAADRQGAQSFSAIGPVSRFRYILNSDASGNAHYGQPFGGRCLGDGNHCVQQALPSQAIYTENLAAGRMFFVELVEDATDSPATTRNGKTSAAYNSTARANLSNGGRITRLIRWDDGLKKAFESNPSIGGAETELTW